MSSLYLVLIACGVAYASLHLADRVEGRLQTAAWRIGVGTALGLLVIWVVWFTVLAERPVSYNDDPACRRMSARC